MEKKVYHVRKKLKLISLRITHKDVYASTNDTSPNSFWPLEVANDRTRDNVLYASINDTSPNSLNERKVGWVDDPSKQKNKKMGRRVLA